MELRHLRHYAVLARRLHFGRAAAELGIAQPALSLSLRALERDVGARLLERGPRHVALTDAGRLMLTEAQAILARADRASAAVRALGEGRAGRLRVNYTRSASGGVSTRIVDAFRLQVPGVALEIDTLYTSRNLEALRTERIDCAFVRPPVDDTGGLQVMALGDEPFVAVLPARHRLAARRRLKRSDLQDEPVVTGARERGPGFFDTMFAAVWGERAPHVVQVEADEDQILRAVARGVGVSVITASRAQSLQHPGVVVRRFAAPEPMAGLALAWRDADTSPQLARFVEVARGFAAT